MDFDELRRRDLGITFHVDTNFLDAPGRSACYLRAMADAHRIHLCIATVGTRELEGASDPEVSDLATGMAVALEAAVSGESRRDEAVYATEIDGEQLEAIRQILAPGGSDSARARTLRDAIHLQTAIRYASDGFITRDRRDILRRANALRPFVRVYDIETAAKIVRLRRRGQRITDRSVPISPLPNG